MRVPACARAQDDFKAAADEAKTLPSGVSNEDQLSLYALFKQANLGDNTTSARGSRVPAPVRAGRAVTAAPLGTGLRLRRVARAHSALPDARAPAPQRAPASWT
jgi:hypothetical protein